MQSLCVSVVGLFAADQPAAPAAVAQLNRIFSENKSAYAKLNKEIAKLKTGKRMGASTDIARAEKKQQAIIDKLKAIKISEKSDMELQATLIEQLKKGRELSNGELSQVHNEVTVNYTNKK